MVERLIFPTFLFVALIGCFVAIAVRAPVTPKHKIHNALFPAYVVVKADGFRG